MEKKLTGNEKVMPETTTDLEYGKIDGVAYGNTYSYGGLTIRQHFAAQAMIGIVSNQAMIDTDNWEWLAYASVKASDALISELNKPTT